MLDDEPTFDRDKMSANLVTSYEVQGSSASASPPLLASAVNNPNPCDPWGALTVHTRRFEDVALGDAKSKLNIDADKVRHGFNNIDKVPPVSRPAPGVRCGGAHEREALC